MVWSWISLVPPPISNILASRISFSSGQLGHVAGAAVNLDGVEGDAHRLLRAVELGERGEPCVELSLALGPGQLEHQVPGVLERELHARQLEGHPLELGDRLPELLARAARSGPTPRRNAR